MTEWRDFAVIDVGDGEETSVSVFVFFTSPPEKLIGTSFTAKVTSCKEKGTVLADILKANGTFP